MLEQTRTAVEESGLKGEVRCWAGLGITALGIAGIFALLLAFSRLPGIESSVPWPLGFFEKGLVIHVIMSFVVWFLAVFAAIITILTATLNAATTMTGRVKLRFMGPSALVLAAVGFVLLALPALLDRGEASLNNYVPVIIDPLYILGLIGFAVALVLVTLRYAVTYLSVREQKTVLSAAGLSGCGILILAFLCVVLAWIPNIGRPPGERLFEDLFWGGGHVLQYLNTALMLMGWYILGSLTGEGETEPVSSRVFGFAMLLCLLPAIGGPVLYAVYGVNSGALTATFTNMQYLMAPPVILMAVSMIRFLVRQVRSGVWRSLGPCCVLLSLLTFAVGGFLGLFIDGTDTRTPAHYHAVIAAVNLVFMGLFFQFILPVTGRPFSPGRSVFVLIWLYAAGQMIASIGLFLAGGYGVPRKTTGDARNLEELGAVTGLYMNGAGAVIAVIGGIMFIWIGARLLLPRWQ